MRQNFVQILVISIIMVIFLIGCSSQESKSVCGNKIVEAGESCDGAGCPSDKICTEKCKCETFSPPALPE